ncbi:MAG: bifunctional 5,10-methylenetetrahydrofolate dehydrogenase/5,10-methenyltetrahydrofolate cyclohydrolase [Eggerthellaceae bacterium]|jgi:methylenetetrahydrofolate dehydrogenase (NADP+)/methenyltetrahydrofolate cyclohydrolase
MARLLLGKPVADHLTEATRAAADELASAGTPPCLAIVRVGERPDDLSYERGALKRAEKAGVAVHSFVLDADAATDDVLAVISQVNADPTIHGCLMFRPLPRAIDEAAVLAALDASKDVDGSTNGALGSLFTDEKRGFAPCTAAACIELLDYYDVPLDSANVVVVGRSMVIGKPVALLALGRNATVTICHSHTADLASVMRGADIVICATGRAKAYGAECFAPGQIVLDVGINVDDEGALCGDVDADAVEPIVDALTPVPRGIGSVTTAVLMGHVVEAARRAR